jgi:NAD(P)-dependent dehydrogenase (short-subunit alcohol dehydrogenase family)
MAGRLADKVAIVTGATSGVGRAIAVLFMNEGAKVVFAGRDESGGSVLEEELRTAGGDVLFVRTDVTKTEDLQYLVNKTVERYGRIDVLVISGGPVVEEVQDDSVGIHIVLYREVLPYMIRQQKGSIVNTSAVADIASEMASPTVGKGAVKAFTQALAAEYADQGIRINCIIPGHAISCATEAGSEEKSIRGVPMGRPARPEEIAWGYVFYASDESSFCTGSTLIIDGGASAV